MVLKEQFSLIVMRYLTIQLAFLVIMKVRGLLKHLFRMSSFQVLVRQFQNIGAWQQQMVLYI